MFLLKANIEDFYGLVSVVDPLSRKWKRDTLPSIGDIVIYFILSQI